jgi:NADH-quinone oxidoreductase subunit C
VSDTSHAPVPVPSDAGSSLEFLRETLCATYPDLCPLFSIEFSDGVLMVTRSQLRTAAEHLRTLGFERFGWVTAVDRGDDFELVYRLQSSRFGVGLFLKTEVPRDEAVIETITDLWPAADWQEREVYDMFGVEFRGHPDLRRILLPDDWVGYPLRKDYRDESMIRRPDYI